MEVDSNCMKVSVLAVITQWVSWNSFGFCGLAESHSLTPGTDAIFFIRGADEGYVTLSDVAIFPKKPQASRYDQRLFK